MKSLLGKIEFWGAFTAAGKYRVAVKPPDGLPTLRCLWLSWWWISLVFEHHTAYLAPSCAADRPLDSLDSINLECNKAWANEKQLVIMEARALINAAVPNSINYFPLGFLNLDACSPSRHCLGCEWCAWQNLFWNSVSEWYLVKCAMLHASRKTVLLIAKLLSSIESAKEWELSSARCAWAECGDPIARSETVKKF